ncbi:MAG TPA: PIN domain nuclease [Candidatus Omnitrophica bacterium]|nr:PIN domain nuclease [Candidatus Omnitrophota bacterium]HBQ38419.1 PIN domain nuclease [Candidatus Omnitrophota bacterium]
MIRFVLDSDTCVFWLRGNRAIERRILEAGTEQVALSMITRCELTYGAWKSARREENLKTLERLHATFTTLQTTDDVSRFFGRWKAQLEGAGAGLDDADLLIAAIAHAHQATLVTNNESHFRRLPGLLVENWTH